MKRSWKSSGVWSTSARLWLTATSDSNLRLGFCPLCRAQEISPLRILEEDLQQCRHFSFLNSSYSQHRGLVGFAALVASATKGESYLTLD